MDGGPFPTLTAEQAKHNIKVRLLARIASACLNSGMLRMARIYVERALYPRRVYDHRFQIINPAELPNREKTVYAEVLHVSARVYYAHGHVREAIGDMSQAQEYRSPHEEEKSRLEAWEKRHIYLLEKAEKRTKSRDLQRQKEGRNTEGIETGTMLLSI